MRKTVIFLCSCLLAGCVGPAPRQSGIALYDLGNLAGAWGAPGLPIASVTVRANSWLDAPAQRYRLVYADSLQRHAYANSRWAAPPAELLERFLQRRIVFGQPDFSGPGCRLQLTLDEIEQRFDTPQSSKIVLEVRASLLPLRSDTLLRGDALLSKRAFLIQKDAPTADAKGGVAATREAAQALADELAQWLNDLARERPQVITLCKEKS
ncbi:MAG: ABC-type transport auxiliary lipoprotein family protein [Rhodocyclaceae bacterium]|nr:ABC-type transport auxiliary lipoprotein family protein [Rhodocyclaceae bacterium]